MSGVGPDMSSQAQPSAAFASHLTASDKREWMLTIEGISFALVRSEHATGPNWLVDERKPIETVDDWALYVLAEDGERVQIGREGGFRANVDPTGSRPSSAQHTKMRMQSLLARARSYAEGAQRLAVMFDQLMAESPARTKKARKIEAAALLALRYHRLIIHGGAVALVTGDAVLVAAKHHSRDEWTELTYRVGDEAVHGAYNLVYIGTIESISPKTIKVIDRHGGKVRRMRHDEFVRYNNRPIDVAHRRNAEWTD